MLCTADVTSWFDHSRHISKQYGVLLADRINCIFFSLFVFNSQRYEKCLIHNCKKTWKPESDDALGGWTVFISRLVLPYTLIILILCVYKYLIALKLFSLEKRVLYSLQDPPPPPVSELSSLRLQRISSYCMSVKGK